MYAETQTEEPNSCQYDANLSWGVSYCYAMEYHPEWFLLKTSGQRAQYTDNGYYMMDMGSASYQQAWATNEIAMAKRDAFDGVYMDDVNLSPGYGTDGTLAKYTDSEYEQAVQSFVAAVGLHAQGSRIDRQRQRGQREFLGTPPRWLRASKWPRTCRSTTTSSGCASMGRR